MQSKATTSKVDCEPRKNIMGEVKQSKRPCSAAKKATTRTRKAREASR
jgi:hypothetical protein